MSDPGSPEQSPEQAPKRAADDTPVVTPEARPFRTAPGMSVLAALDTLGGRYHSVTVGAGGDEDATPVTVKRATGGLADDSRFQVLGEIARGGIGVVYRGRDKELNRELAIKVLREEYIGNGDVVARFVEEAQVGGQLQHPGIVPIYGMGLQPDGRPCFAMRLIKGQTLAALLDSNPKKIDLISIFEQIAQTMAYAHSRRVIHRDLKPANVMVGAYGEVLVVDWGFAKVLRREEARVEAPQSVIATVRSVEEGSHSLVGSIMGTPAYMPPEQAMGNNETLDARCDVFSLGAILCEILTGKPPYTGPIRDQMIAAAQCRLEPAFQRLAAADVPEGLRQIVHACLQSLPSDRPADARGVADRLNAYLSGVQRQARQAEVDLLSAEMRATQHRKARKRALVLAGVLVGTVVAGGGTYLSWRREREQRQARAEPEVAAALRTAARCESLNDWEGAVAAARKAVGIAGSEGVDDAGAGTMLLRFTQARDAAERAARTRAEDEELLAELRAIRNLAPVQTRSGGSAPGAGGAPGVWRQPGDRYRAMDTAYSDAFQRRFGSLAAALPRLAASRLAPDFAADLGNWCQLRRTAEALAGSDWASLDAAARQLDPANTDLRDALLASDAEALLASVAKRGDMLPLPLVSQAAERLIDIGQPQSAIDLLLSWNRRFPDETVIHVRLAQASRSVFLAEGGDDSIEAAIRYAQAAVALRPEVDLGWYVLGTCLSSAREFEHAAAAFERALALTPGYLDAYGQQADALVAVGRAEEAVAVLKRALDVNARDADLNLRLAWILVEPLGRFRDSVTACRRAIQIDPQSWPAHVLLAVALLGQNDRTGARDAVQKVLTLAPGSADARAEAGRVLYLLGDLERSAQECRAALGIDASHRAATLQLAQVFQRQWDLEGAAAEYERLLAASPRDVESLVRSAEVCRARGDSKEAFARAQRAAEIDPDHAGAQASLALGLLREGDRAGARTAVERALELAPRLALAHVAMASVQATERRLEEALASAAKAIELEPSQFEGHELLALLNASRGDREPALAAHARLATLLAGIPAAEVEAQLLLARVHETLGEWSGALAVYDKLPDASRRRIDVRMRIGVARLRLGDTRGSAAEFEQIVAAEPSRMSAWSYLGVARWRSDDVEGADAALTKARELGEENPFILGLHGEVLLERGRVRPAIKLLEQVARSDGSSARHSYLLGDAYLAAGRVDEARESFQECINQSPGYALAFQGLGRAHAAVADRKAALAMFRKAVELAPSQVVPQVNLGRMLARMGELDAAVSVLTKAAASDAEHADALAEVKRLAELAPRLAAVLAGESKPANAQDTLHFARLAQSGEQHEAATRLFEDALGADPSLAAQPKARVYLQAASAAVRAGPGQFALALRWLRQELDAFAALGAEDHPYLRQMLPCLKLNLDLAAVRDGSELAPEWQEYWDDVDALIARVAESE